MRSVEVAYLPVPFLNKGLWYSSSRGACWRRSVGVVRTGSRAAPCVWPRPLRRLQPLRASASADDSEPQQEHPGEYSVRNASTEAQDGEADGKRDFELSGAVAPVPSSEPASDVMLSTTDPGITSDWAKRLTNLRGGSTTNAMPVEEPISISTSQSVVTPDHQLLADDATMTGTRPERRHAETDPYEWPIANFDASDLSWISAAEMTEWMGLEHSRREVASSAPSTETPAVTEPTKSKAENLSPSNTSNGSAGLANGAAFVSFLRNCSPYVYAHRNKTFVIHIPGQMLLNRPLFDTFMQDVALIKSLGVRVVLVGGCRPQIDRSLERHGVEQRFVRGIRISSPEVMQAVLEASGYVRFAIESALQRRPSNSVSLRTPNVVSGNFFTAQPIGVVEGVDFGYTGRVRKIDVSKIEKRLDEDEIVVLSNVGFAPSGAVFNCQSEEVASSCASQLHADKLIFMTEGEMLVDLGTRTVMHNIPLRAAMEFLHLDEQRRRTSSPMTTTPAPVRAMDGARRMPALFHLYLQEGVRALQGGVTRAHLINMFIDGAILIELFTRDGVGLMVSRDIYEGIRSAKIADIPGIMDLIRPLESEGILVPRSRETLEAEIHRFLVVVRDGMVTACAALVPYGAGDEAEIACFVVSPQYRGRGKGDALLGFLERRALSQGIRRIFILSVRAFHWFLERGFREGTVDDLPAEKRGKYNFLRRSKIYIKDLSSQREVDEEELLRGL
ncbi:hypothetical protein CCYA_CCYA19G4647 [Cyanidiococcus yangmingshanensis]|nr:hypothetical protein CCYA_CCYA19G4647 [Cyanidiococcus yangmingshanensis]